MRQLFERRLMEADECQRDRWLAGAAVLAADVLLGAPGGTSGAHAPDPSAGDPGFAWHHGLYWLASNLSVDSPLVLVVDDLQWCDAPSARALGFVARRLEGQPLGLIIATRPLDPALTPEAATLVADPSVELLRPTPLTPSAVGALVAARLPGECHDQFVRACIEVTGGNPFLLGELLDEAAARGVEPTRTAAADVGAIVPRGVANAVLLRLARLPPPAAALARALSVLGDGARIGDAAQLAGLDSAVAEAATGLLVSAGVVDSGALRFTHPILRAAIYNDLSPAERERLHHAGARILRERGAPASQVAPQLLQTEPAGDAATVAVLRDAARTVLALGDAASAAALLVGHSTSLRTAASEPPWCSNSARRTPAREHRRRSRR